MSRPNLSDLVLIAAVLFLFVVSSTMSFEDEVQRLENYCEMVNDSSWPPYNPNMNCEE